MDHLKQIIHVLSDEEVREFRTFIHRQKRKPGRKDLKLFDLLLQEKTYSATDFCKLLDTPNKVAYYAIRKRLQHHLSDFLVLKRKDEDTTSLSPIMGLISTARYLFDKKANDLAWLYLKKAEKLAERTQQLHLLNGIYMIQIEWFTYDDNADIDVAAINRKRHQNRKHIDEEERIIIANSFIKQELRQQRSKGQILDINRTMRAIIKNYDLGEVWDSRPKLLYMLLSITRNLFVARRERLNLVSFVIERYELLKAEGRFGEYNHLYKIQILYVLCHLLYRNFRYETALKYLDEFHESILLYPKVFSRNFLPKYLLLKSVVLSLTNRNDEAIQLLQEGLGRKQTSFASADALNFRINLAIFHIYAQQYQLANQTLMDIQHSDNWCMKRMGKDWVMKKNMVELLIQYHFEHTDIALNRVRALERQLQHTKDGLMKRLLVIVKLVKQLITSELDKKSLSDTLNKHFPSPADSLQNIQILNFYSWLKAAIEDQDFYLVLLKEVEQQKALS